MSEFPENQFNRLLELVRSGDREQIPELLSLAHPQLEKIAARRLRREANTLFLDEGDLVQEVIIRLLSKEDNFAKFQDSHHFFAWVSQSMRHIIIDHFRRENGKMRGGNNLFLNIDEVSDTLAVQPAPALVALSDALDDLEKHHPRSAMIVELRVFAGLNFEEAAAFIGISTATVYRDWEFAKAWLRRCVKIS